MGVLGEPLDDGIGVGLGDRDICAGAPVHARNGIAGIRVINKKNPYFLYLCYLDFITFTL